MKGSHTVALLGAPVWLLACGGAGQSSSATCVGPACDDTGSAADCETRSGEVFGNPGRLGFGPDFVRWPCKDSGGVRTDNRDERGQEHCEHFAIVQPPPLVSGSIERPQAVDLARPTAGGTTARGLELNDHQKGWLAANPSAVLGACVFTSWHSDVDVPLSVCPNDACSDDAQVFGFSFAREHFQMKAGINSNAAAAELIQRCVDRADAAAGGSADGAFERGCAQVAEAIGPSWRSSDASICAVANRLAECGCGLPGVEPAGLGRAIVPAQPDPLGKATLRGFPLGRWSDPRDVPTGCRYANIGDSSRTIVLCDLRGSELATALDDPAHACVEKYGADVVVHMPLPSTALTCSAGDDLGCDCQPWAIGNADQACMAGEGESSADDSTSGGDQGSPCCSAQAGPGCATPEIQACVCDTDSFCCVAQWDEICVGEVNSLGCGDCQTAA